MCYLKVWVLRFRVCSPLTLSGCDSLSLAKKPYENMTLLVQTCRAIRFNWHMRLLCKQPWRRNLRLYIVVNWLKWRTKSNMCRCWNVKNKSTKRLKSKIALAWFEYCNGRFSSTETHFSQAGNLWCMGSFTMTCRTYTKTWFDMLPVCCISGWNCPCGRSPR